MQFADTGVERQVTDNQPRAAVGLLEDIVGSLSEGVAYYDRDERLVFFNDVYAKQFGSAAARVEAGVTASQLAAAMAATEHGESSGGNGDHEWADAEMTDFRAAAGRPCLRRTQDGRYHSVVYSRTRDGGTVVTWTAVTEQRRLQEMLAKQGRFIQTLADQEEYLRQTLKIVSEGVIGIDRRGVIHTFNLAAQRIFGYEPEEIIGHNVNLLMPESDAAAHDGFVQHYLDTGDARVIGTGREVLGLRKSGEIFPMRLAIAETLVSRTVRFIGIATDLSQTRDIEAQLRHVEKLKSVGQLTEGIAHDFNNLLAVILINLRKLEAGGDILPDASAHVAAALRATVTAGELAKHLLIFSRQSPPHPMVVDPSMVVTDAIDMLTPILGRQIAVRAQLGRDLPAVMVEPAQLQNALVNLAINARDAMSGSGTLAISVREASAKERSRSASAIGGSQGVIVVEIEDNGHGMTPEIVERAAMPFFTTKDVGEGSGLGLSMVQRFIEEAGGDMQIDSEPGVGTAVRLLLPTVVDSQRPSR